MIFILFLLFNAKEVEFEETKDKCDRRLIKNLILEKYDLFKGYSEEIISKRFLEEDDFFLEIKDEYFKDNSLIRFKVKGWYKKSNIYASDFFIGNSLINICHVKTLLRFYTSVLILMNKDESFKKEIIEDCVEKDPGPIIAGCYYRFITYKKMFINVDKEKSSFKGDDFKLFKLICLTLFKEINSRDEISGLFSNFNKKKSTDIFIISKRLIKIMDELNDYMKYSKVIEKYSKDERYSKYLKDFD